MDRKKIFKKEQKNFVGESQSVIFKYHMTKCILNITW